MASPTIDHPQVDTDELRREMQGSGSWGDRGFTWLVVGSGAFVLLVLALITETMLQRSFKVWSHQGWSYFTSRVWDPPTQHYGILAFIWGTFYTAVIGLLVAVPISLGISLFITQVAPDWLKKIMVYIIDLVAVIPSVVIGLWGFLVLSQHLGGLYGWLSRTFDGWPILGHIFGPNPQTRSFLTAGLILALMITPIIVSVSREVIDTTPQGEREAALALGATKWEMIRGAVIPHSKGGLVGAVMLGLGRAMGETIAVALTIGSSLGVITFNTLTSGNSMPAMITAEWGEADELKKSALIAMALTLFVMTIIVNVIATSVVQRSQLKSRGKV
jgi:phosphate transport system permease protein